MVYKATNIPSITGMYVFLFRVSVWLQSPLQAIETREVLEDR